MGAAAAPFTRLNLHGALTKKADSIKAKQSQEPIAIYPSLRDIKYSLGVNDAPTPFL